MWFLFSLLEITILARALRIESGPRMLNWADSMALVYIRGQLLTDYKTSWPSLWQSAHFTDRSW